MENQKLTLVEQSLAMTAGMHRFLQNQKNGTNSNSSRLDKDVRGVGGEITVAKWLNVYPQLTTGPHRGGPDLDFKGETIDVKTTKHSPAFLKASLKTKVTASDIYILVHESVFPVYKIIGAIRAEEFIQEGNINDTGWGKEYSLEEHQLDSLKVALEKPNVNETFLPWNDTINENAR